jgi:hypothetical protein
MSDIDSNIIAFQEPLISDFDPDIITFQEPSRLSEESTSSTLFLSIKRRNKLLRAISIFKRESQKAREEVEAASTDPPAMVDTKNDSDNTPPPSPTVRVYPDLTPLLGTQAHVSPSTPGQKAETEAVWNDVRHALISFNIRLRAPLMSPLNISPVSRAPFEAMVWTLLIVDHPTPTDRDASIPTLPIPVVKSLCVYNISVPLSPNTSTANDMLNIYFKRTEALVQIYSMPPNVTSKLAKIATEINGCKFARYMGSRGPWSLRKVYGGLQVLLHWWAATSPALMVDFSKAVSLNSKDDPPGTCTRLRAELRELFNIDMDHDGYEKTLNTAISRGYDDISMFRRELHTVIQDAFEDLVEKTRAAEVDSDSETLTAGE